jgi:hypothetical protein
LVTPWFCRRCPVEARSRASRSSCRSSSSQLGTAVALLIYFRRDWLDFARSIVGRDPERTAADRRLFVMIVIATISAALIGFFSEARLRTSYASPLIAASFLVLNGIILHGLRATRYDIPLGCCASYYPECNPLIPLWHHAEGSHVPAAKAIPVRVVRG